MLFEETVTARNSCIELGDVEFEVFEDETHMFVEDTLAAVSEATSMNEQYVLPMGRLPVARPDKPPMPATSPRHKVVILDKATVLAAMPTPIDPILLQPRPYGPETPKPKKRSRPKMWPVYMCAFIASVFAGGAIMQSPASVHVHHAINAVAAAISG